MNEATSNVSVAASSVANTAEISSAFSNSSSKGSAESETRSPLLKSKSQKRKERREKMNEYFTSMSLPTPPELNQTDEIKPPLFEEMSSPINEKTASPVNEKTASPVNKKTASPVNEETASPVNEKTLTVSLLNKTETPSSTPPTYHIPKLILPTYPSVTADTPSVKSATSSVKAGTQSMTAFTPTMTAVTPSMKAVTPSPHSMISSLGVEYVDLSDFLERPRFWIKRETVEKAIVCNPDKKALNLNDPNVAGKFAIL